MTPTVRALPTVGGDSGTWGTKLNAWLEQGLGFDGLTWINCKDPAYGAVGNGTTDDTAAIQAALNAAYIGVNQAHTVFLPPGTYKITSQLTIPNSSQGIRFVGCGMWVSQIVQYTAGQAIIRLLQNNDAVSNHSAEVKDIGLSYSAAQSNAASIGILFDWVAPATNDIHFHDLFENLGIFNAYTGISVAKAHGTVNVWDTTFRRIWMGGIYQSCVDLVSAGGGGQPAVRFYDCYFSNSGTTNHGPMFYFEGIGECVMVGLDLENWHGQIMNTDSGNVKIVGMHIENMIWDQTGATRVFFVTNGCLSVDTWTIGNTSTTAACDTMAVLFGAGGAGRLDIRNGEHNVTTTLGAHYIDELVYGATSDSVWIDVTNVKKTGGGLNQPGTGARAAEVGELLREGPRALTYAGTVAAYDCTNPSRILKIAATNGTAFTISNPTNMIAGDRITYDIKNSSGTNMGAVTWGSGGTFLLPGGTFTRPANTKRATMSFYYDGTNLVADGPQSGDA